MYNILDLNVFYLNILCFFFKRKFQSSQLQSALMERNADYVHHVFEPTNNRDYDAFHNQAALPYSITSNTHQRLRVLCVSHLVVSMSAL